MKKLYVLLVVALLVSLVQGAAGVRASAFTVVVTLNQYAILEQGSLTVQAHTRIGATCSARVTYLHDTASNALTPLHQHVGTTGMLHWTWFAHTHSDVGIVLVTCSFKGQTRTGTTVFAVHHAAPPRPVAYEGAILGASYGDWVHALGPIMSNTTTDNAGWFRCGDTATAGLLVHLTSGSADSVGGQVCSGFPMPTDVEAQARARAYMPDDSVYLHTTSTPAGTTMVVWQSAKLAQLISDQWQYTDCNGNDVPVGTFSIALNFDGGGDWNLGTGSCYQ